MKNERKGFIVPILLGIIILLLVAMCGIYVYKNKQADQVPAAAPASTSTANTQQQSSDGSAAVPVKSIYKPTASPSSYLTSKTWFWSSTLSLADGFFTEPMDKSKFKLTFSSSDDDTFSASTDCNSFKGEYEITGNIITFNKMMSTEMYCKGSREAEYRKMLEQVQSFDIDTDGALLLMLKDNRRMLYLPK